MLKNVFGYRIDYKRYFQISVKTLKFGAHTFGIIRKKYLSSFMEIKRSNLIAEKKSRYQEN